MKKMTRLLAMLLALVMLALPALAESSPEDVLATVYGMPVTRAQYDDALTQMEDMYSSYGYDVTDPTIASVLQQIALDTAIEYALLTKVIEDNGLQLTDEELADSAQAAREDFNAQVDQIVDEYGYYGMADISTEESRAAVLVMVLSQLEAMGVTEASYIADIQRFDGYNKAYDWIVRDVTVTDEEVRAHFDELVEADRVAYENDVLAYETMQQQNQMALMYGMNDYYTDLYYVPTGFRLVTHILLEADETALNAYVAAKQSADSEALAAAAQAVLASVQTTVDEINGRLANGEAFNDLIPEYTADPGMSDAVSIAAGYEVHPQSTMWVTEFRDAAFTVDNVGDVAAPVVTDYGVHIVYYMADVPGGPVEFTDDIAALMREELLTARQSNVYAETMTAMLAEAEIVYSEEAQAIMGTN